ncbi:MAG: Ig-like domain-containing protein [Oscillospiraceae bacterium]
MTKSKGKLSIIISLVVFSLMLFSSVVFLNSTNNQNSKNNIENKNTTFVKGVGFTFTDTFTDPELATIISALVGKTAADDIEQVDIDAITSISNINSVISDLSGIEFLTALTSVEFTAPNISVLPTNLNNLTNLTSFKLIGHQLTSIPASLTNRTSLTVLELTNGLIDEVPASISNLTNLTLLNLSNNKIKNFLPDISGINGLTTLNLSNNELTSLPVNFDSQSLESLNVAFNDLTGAGLPFIWSQLISLENLNLSNNELDSIPSGNGFSDMSNILTMDLSHNKLTTLPSFTQYPLLTNLNLQNNLLTIIPGPIDVNTTPAISNLNISNNSIVDLPDFTGLTSLTNLNASNNNIDVIPGNISSATALITVDLRGNKIHSLAGVLVAPLTALTSFNVSNQSPSVSGIRGDITLLPDYIITINILEPDGTFIVPTNISDNGVYRAGNPAEIIWAGLPDANKLLTYDYAYNQGVTSFSGTFSVNVTSTSSPKDFSQLTIDSSSVIDVSFTGTAHTPVIPEIMDGGVRLILNTHYGIRYSANINAGTAIVEVFAVPNAGYQGIQTFRFKISPIAPTVNNLPIVSESILEGSPLSDLPLIGGSATGLNSAAVSGRFTFKNITTLANPNVTSYPVVFRSSNQNYTNVDVNVDVVVLKDIKKSVVYPFAPSVPYNTKAVEPKPSAVEYSGTMLTLGTDYDLLYLNNVNAGNATVSLVGVGSYGGQLDVSFEIQKVDPSLKVLPKSTSITAGQSLSNSTLNGGNVSGLLGEDVSGSFIWASPSTVPSSSGQHEAMFISHNSNYENITFQLSLTVTPRNTNNNVNPDSETNNNQGTTGTESDGNNDGTSSQDDPDVQGGEDQNTEDNNDNTTGENNSGGNNNQDSDKNENNAEESGSSNSALPIDVASVAVIGGGAGFYLMKKRPKV